MEFTPFVYNNVVIIYNSKLQSYIDKHLELYITFCHKKRIASEKYT